MSDQERRRDQRIPSEVKVDYRTIGSFITDYAKDISQGGLFVQTALPLDVGQRVRLRVTLPDRTLPFALDGVVRWIIPAKEVRDAKAPPGMGIEFVDFDDEIREELRRFVAGLDGAE